MVKKVENKVVTTLSKDVSDFKKKVKHFKKVSKKDFKQGIELAKELIGDTNNLLKKDDNALRKVVKREEVAKLKDSLLLYIENVSNIMSFQEKYSKTKGVVK